MNDPHLRSKYTRVRFVYDELRFILEWMTEDNISPDRLMAARVNELENLLWHYEQRIRAQNRAAAEARIKARA